ncbi:uncharacterized protein OCT59_018948 [Rhizophagus irregularis]|uniref:F-box domain-containing protein n=1 Tax=Rhizophagus irregularis (strain DAOM 197198w) TaxID=1432141 RepID=A0A015IPP2_RHIIW|nr:hypothetical protein RirG_218200 [Rhizophagus irregularis DAOM 197198w]UZO26734.1 hypothetical protein OCT59_018948 [Rhizophagus irregularis]GBC34194.1 hypothetical protein GLOIN_2v1877797 [Rhizophagus irregularis DAOM 181602=DAOM 197198]
MSYSKVFSGDLPELTYEIIKYFQNDISTLHSCILVNRLWCRLAIPLLWENPFSFRTGNYNFIEIYLHNLNNDLKSRLNEYKINDNSLPLNTLFNYPRLLKYLNTFNIDSCVEIWFEVAVRTSKPGNRYFLKDLSSYSVSDFKRLINISLFKIFIENEVNLRTLEIEIPNIYSSKYLNYILEIILQNTNFIHNIRNLNLYIIKSSNVSDDNINNEYELIENRVSQIINLHQNTKKILLSNDNIPLFQSLLLSKHSNCSNTLNTIIFYYANLNGMINLDKIFKQLNVLESVHIIYCYSLNTRFIQQIINLTKPIKLKSLFINDLSQVDKSLPLLIQKYGDYLENFGFVLGDLSQKQQLGELIIKYCKNIKFIDFYEFESNHQIITNYIENIRQNLNYLSIKIVYEDPNGNGERSSTLLQNLGQTLPSKLEYLSLTLRIKENDFRVFLENSQNIFINKLKIMQDDSYSNILHCIKEYIMKEKRVNYLAISNHRGDDLYFFKDEVKEFNLYNIKVLNFYDLALAYNAYNLVRKID